MFYINHIFTLQRFATSSKIHVKLSVCYDNISTEVMETPEFPRQEIDNSLK
jgi:hypothetical protein